MCPIPSHIPSEPSRLTYRMFRCCKTASVWRGRWDLRRRLSASLDLPSSIHMPSFSSVYTYQNTFQTGPMRPKWAVANRHLPPHNPCSSLMPRSIPSCTCILCLCRKMHFDHSLRWLNKSPGPTLPSLRFNMNLVPVTVYYSENKFYYS